MQQETLISVIPAKAGVQTEADLDTGLRRYDEQSRGS
jgi:hypothetical protein